VSRSQRSRSSRSGPGRLLGLFLLANLLPLAGLAYLGLRWLRGDRPEIDLPEGTGANLGVLGGGRVLLLLAASVSLPNAHRATRRLHAVLRRRVAILMGRERGSRLLSVLLYVPLVLAYALAALVRFVLIVLSLAILAVCVVFIVRLLEPGFAQEWIDSVLVYPS